MTFTTRLLTEAAHGGLKPPPTKRLRRVLLHLSYGMTLARLLDTTLLRYSRLAVLAACASPLASGNWFLQFRAKACVQLAPPIRRPPSARSSGSPRTHLRRKK